MIPEKILSELIQINTSNPPGNETAAARYLAELLQQVGIDCEIIEPAAGRGSLIARFGAGPRKLLYISHLDVVTWSPRGTIGISNLSLARSRGARFTDAEPLIAKIWPRRRSVQRWSWPVKGSP